MEWSACRTLERKTFERAFEKSFDGIAVTLQGNETLQPQH